jgi:hypothetical protein
VQSAMLAEKGMKGMKERERAAFYADNKAASHRLGDCLK